VSDIENRDSTFDLNIALVDALLVKVVERKRLFQGKYVLGLVVAHQRIRMVSRLSLQRTSRIAASLPGSRSPVTIARMIRSPVTPVIVAITWCSWIFMKVSAFCMCWICAAA